MKTFVVVLALAATVLTGGPISSGYAQPAGEISFQLFYDSLSPYGNWVYTDDYGYCWNPSVEEGWRPYTDGSWAYTDGGWTWSSNEPWGWATYHYGRWVETSGNGWLWVPGTEWAPAWVSWRTNDEYVGWAPLPPEAAWQPSYGFSTGVDIAFNIPPAYYTFCPAPFFSAPYIRPHCLPRGRNVGIFNDTVNVTNIAVTNVNNNTVIFNKGPDYDWVSRGSKYPVRQARLERWSDLDPERVRGGYAWNRMEKGVYRAYAPRVSRWDEKERPARIAAEYRGDQLQRAWRSNEWKGRGENGRTAARDADESRRYRDSDSKAPWDRSAAMIERQRSAARQAERERQSENAQARRPQGGNARWAGQSDDEQPRRPQDANARWSQVRDVDERGNATVRDQGTARRAAAARQQEASSRAERSRESAAAAAWRRDQNARNVQRKEEAFEQQQQQEEARRNAARRNAQSGEEQRQAYQRNIQRQQVAEREREAASSRRQQQAEQVRRGAAQSQQQRNASQNQQRQQREQAAVQQRQQQQRQAWQNQQRQNQQRQEVNRQQQQRPAAQGNWQRQQQQRQASQANWQRQQQNQKQAAQQGKQQQRRQQGDREKKEKGEE